MNSHGVVTLRSGTIFCVTKEDYNELLEEFVGDKTLVTPPRNSYFKATNPYNGSATVVDLNEVVALEWVDEEGVRSEIEFKQRISDIYDELQGPEWEQGGGPSF